MPIQKIKCFRKHCQGFTLLEIMLVIFLFGTLSALIMINLPDKNKVLDGESKRLLEVVRLTSERANLENRIYGIVFEAHKWQLLLFDINNVEPDWYSTLLSDVDWQAAKNRGREISRTLPENLQLQFDLEQSAITLPALDSNELSKAPQMIFFPGSEMAKFRLTITDTQTQVLRQIGLDEAGKIQLMDPESDTDE